MPANPRARGVHASKACSRVPPARCSNRTALPAFFLRQRWFGSKARPIARVRVFDGGPLQPPLTPFLAIADVEFVDGGTERYALPLTVLADPETSALLSSRPAAAIAWIDTDGGRLLTDALADDNACRGLLAAIDARRQFGFIDGSVVSLRDVPSVVDSPLTDVPGAPQRRRAEQLLGHLRARVDPQDVPAARARSASRAGARPLPAQRRLQRRAGGARLDGVHDGARELGPGGAARARAGQHGRLGARPRARRAVLRARRRRPRRPRAIARPAGHAARTAAPAISLRPRSSRLAPTSQRPTRSATRRPPCTSRSHAAPTPRSCPSRSPGRTCGSSWRAPVNARAARSPCSRRGCRCSRVTPPRASRRCSPCSRRSFARLDDARRRASDGDEDALPPGLPPRSAAVDRHDATRCSTSRASLPGPSQTAGASARP